MGDSSGLFLAVMGWVVAFYFTSKAERKASTILFSRNQFALSMFLKGLAFFGTVASILMLLTLGLFSFILGPALIAAFVVSGLFYAIASFLYPLRNRRLHSLFIGALLVGIVVIIISFLANKAFAHFAW